METLKGKWGLVTGASSGLGVDFARQLAMRGCNLILSARRQAQLQAVQAELRREYGVEVDVIPMDLATAGAAQRLYDQLRAMGRNVDVLVNNAGYGLFGEFVEIPWERERKMLELDIVTVTEMTKLMVRDMVERDFGYVLQVASIGAYQPSPLYATYSAAKSYVLNFSEALNYELRNTRVRCTVISPGITRTEFLSVSGQQPSFYQRLMLMESEEVARIGIESMLKGRPSVVPGWLNTLTVWSNRLLSRRMATAVAYRLMRA
jgi:uncharacterized protein